MEPLQDYNSLLESVQAPQKLYGETLDSEIARNVRDAFFDDVRTSLERELSHGALAIALSVQRVVSPPQGRGHTDRGDELTLVGSMHHPSPLAMALETHEHGLSIVTFNLVPLNKFGNRALQALKQADEAFSNSTFRS